MQQRASSARPAQAGARAPSLEILRQTAISPAVPAVGPGAATRGGVLPQSSVHSPGVLVFRSVSAWALPQRPSGGGGGARGPLQRKWSRSSSSEPQSASPEQLSALLERAETPKQVLALVEQCRGISGAAATGPYVAGLGALARCYAPAETRASLSPGSNEVLELQDCILHAVTALHARLGLLSYSQLVDVLAALAVLLPLAQWPLRKDRLLPDLAMALPAAAAALAPRMPALLPKLRLGLGAVKELAEAGEAGGAWPDAQEAVDAAAAYLERDLYGSEELLQRLDSADMAGLCAAVELSALFEVDPGPSFVASACGRMSSLLAEATEAGLRAEMDRAAGNRVTTSARKPFDMDALESALVAWCRAYPQHAAPSDSWLQAHAAVVLRAYDPATADRRWEALSRLADHGSSADLEAEAKDLWDELMALGPVASSGQAPVSAKPQQSASLPGPRRVEGLLALLSGLAARLGSRAGGEVGRLAEAAVAAHLEDMAPSQIIATLEALASLRVASPNMVGTALQMLRPTLPKLSSQDAVRLLRALWTLDYTPPALPRNGMPSAGELVASIVASLHLSAASTTELILLVVCCEHWRVPFPQLSELQVAVETRVLRELPPDVVRTLSAQAQAMAEGLPSAEAAQTATAGGTVEDPLRPVLLQGIVLPLTTLHQPFTAPDMLAVALADWSDGGFPSLTVRSATALLNSFMANRGWPLAPGLRRGLLALMPAALAVPCDAPGQLSRLLLAVGRSVRLIAEKMQRPGEPDLAAAVAPDTEAALLPALERLMALRPSASHLGLAAQGLFVEARWRPRQLPAVTDPPGPSASTAGPDAPSRQLLARILELARASLAATAASGSAPPLVHGSSVAPAGLVPLTCLLSACATLGYYPRDMLAELYAATAAALNAGKQSAPAESLPTLLRAVWALERRLGSAEERTPAGEPGHGAGHWEQPLASPSASLESARDELLEALAGALLPAPALSKERSLQYSSLSEIVEQLVGLGARPQPEWLSTYATAVQHVAATLAPARLLSSVHTLAAVHAAAAGGHRKEVTPAAAGAIAQALTQPQVLEALSDQPDTLVTAVRQLAVLGFRPEPTWLESYVSTVRDVAPKLSRTGLAYAAEGLALLRAAPPAVVLEVLLAQAERDLTRFDVLSLGLLLGGVHSLWQNRLRVEGQLGAGADTEAAGLSAGSGARSAPALSGEALATLYRATALFVSEDRREKVLPKYSQAQLLMVSGAVAALELQRSRERGGRVATADLLGRVEPEWLLECCTSLIQARKASGRAAELHDGARSGLLLNLLRLAFFALGSSQTDSAEAEPARSATAIAVAVTVSQYVRLSLEDLGRGGTGAASAAASERALVVREWVPLLEAFVAVGMRPDDAALEAYTSALFEAAVATAAEGKAPLETGWSLADYAAWQQLCAGLSSMLLRALPWAPSAQQLLGLEAGFLDRPTSLPSASTGQLAAVCTYAAAVGRRFAPKEWWRALANELRRRGPPPPVAEAAAAALHGRSGQLNSKAAAAVKAARDEAVTAWGPEYGSVRLCLDDLVAVLYGMEASGVGVGSRRLDEPEAWVRQLLELSVPAGGPPVASTAGAPPSERQLLRALALLWTTRRLGRLDCVPPRVWAVAFGHTGPAPWPQPAKALPAKQLGQLALLWAEVARAGNPRGLTGPSPEFAADLLAALEAAARQETLTVQPAEAAAALLHLSEEDSSTAGRCPVLVAKAVASLGSEVPLEEILPLLCIVSSIPAAVRKAVVMRLTEAPEAGGMPLLRFSPSERYQMASRLVGLTPLGDPSSINAVLPLLQALLPNAEAELYGMAAQERMGPAVVAAALDAVEEVTIRTDEPASGQGAVAAAAIAAAATKAKVEDAASRLKRRAGDRLQPNTIPELPPESIASLVVGVLALSGGARLPAPAAAALLRLLAVPGVLGLLPTYAPDVLIVKGFLDANIPLPDAAVAALDSRLTFEQSSSAEPLIRGLVRARTFRMSGASAARSHAALLALHLDPGAVERLGASEVIFVLQELYDSGVVERVSPIQQHLGLLYGDEDVPQQVPPPDKTQTPGSSSAGSAAADEDHRPPPSDSSAAEDDPFAELRFNMATTLLEELAGTCAEAAALRPQPLGPFSLLTLRLLRRASWLAPCGWCNIERAADVLQLAVALRTRLPGIEGRHLYWQSVQNIGNPAVFASEEADVEGAALLEGPDGALWKLLDASLALCGVPITRMTHRFTTRRVAEMHFEVFSLEAATAAGQRTDAALAAAWAFTFRALRGALVTACGMLGPFQLQPSAGLWVLRQAQARLRSHKEALAPPQGTPLALPPVLPNGDEDLPPPLLSTRQLGVLFGLVALRSSFSSMACEKELAKARAEVGELYRSSLDRLAGRTDLPPLAHLNAVLQALEPAVMDTTQYEPGTLLPANLYERDLPVERWLAPPVLRILAGEADDVYNAFGEGPYGLGDDDARMERELRRRREEGTKAAAPIDLMAPLQMAMDDRVLLRAHAEIDGELLAANLVRSRDIESVPELSRLMYEDSTRKSAPAWPEQKWPNGRRKYRVSSYQAGSLGTDLCIPRWLAPPAGSRHGDGSDPDGDALREAYARRVGAWAEAARCVVNMAYATGRQEQLQERLRACKGKGGRGRWALLFAAVRDDTVWGGPQAVAALGDELQATRKEVASVLRRHVVLRPPSPQPAGSSGGANKSPQLALKTKPKAKKQLVQKTGKGFAPAAAVKQPARVEPRQLLHAMRAMKQAEDFFSLATERARGLAGGDEKEAGDSPGQASESTAGAQPGDKELPGKGVGDGELGSGDGGKGFGAAKAKGKAKRR